MASNPTTIIQKVSALLTSLGVPAACFDALHLCPEATFARHLRPFNNLEKPQTERMLRIGIDLGIFRSLETLDIGQFINFLHFIQTPQWHEEVQRKATVDLLAGSAGENFTPAEIAWVKIFDLQRADTGMTPAFEYHGVAKDEQEFLEYYGSDERKRRIVDYLNDEDEKARLRDYVEERTAKLMGTREAKRLSFLLEVASGQQCQDPVSKRRRLE